MFSKIRESIDNRIAEEQARQRRTASPSASTSSNAAKNRPAQSPTKKLRQSKEGSGDGNSIGGPDPSEFVIEDGEEAETQDNPAADMATENGNVDTGTEKQMAGATEAAAPGISPKDLPADVVKRLNRLAKYEISYPKILESYRHAYPRVGQIDAFEKVLKTKTHAKVNTIAEPAALVEYLAGLEAKIASSKKDLTNMTGDRDLFQKKLVESEVELERVTEDRGLYKKKFDKTSTELKTACNQRDEYEEKAKLNPQLNDLIASLAAENDGLKRKVSEHEKEVADLKIQLSTAQASAESSAEAPKTDSASEVQTSEVAELKSQVSSLEQSLAVAETSKLEYINALEKIVNGLNVSSGASADAQSQGQVVALSIRLQQIIAAQEDLISQSKEHQSLKSENDSMKEQNKAIEGRVEALTADVATMKQSEEKASELLSRTKAELETQKASSETDSQSLVNTRERMVALELQIEKLTEEKASTAQEVKEMSAQLESLRRAGRDIEVPAATNASIPSTPVDAAAPASKKKNTKKKKKGGATAPATATNVIESTAESVPSGLEVDISKLEQDLLKTNEELKKVQQSLNAATKLGNEQQTVNQNLLAEKSALKVQVETLQSKAESMTSDVDLAQLKSELADKDREIQKLQSKRKTEADLREELEGYAENYMQVSNEHVEAKTKIKDLQAHIVTLESEKNEKESQLAERKTVAEYAELVAKSETLRKDLGASEQLAASRYKELTNLKDILQKMQPELNDLRTENAKFKSANDELNAKNSQLKRLEAREKDLKREIDTLKKQAAERDTEIKQLNDKIVQETKSRAQAEEQTRDAQRKMRRSENDKIQLSALGEKATMELGHVQKEAGELLSQVKSMESQIAKLTRDSSELEDKVQLKSSQYESAQGLLDSMISQADEMRWQLKEAKQNSETLKDELDESQRLLDERTREAATMGALLANGDASTEEKLREMREQMDAAIAERDRVEDEANTKGRSRAKQLEELKEKIRTFEKDLKDMTDERDALARSEKLLKEKRDELERTVQDNAQAVDDACSARDSLRDALDSSNAQAQVWETQRADLRKRLEESSAKYERLEREHKALQAKQAKLNSPTESRPTSPAMNGSGAATDSGYLSVILLQFLQLKDKKRQADLLNTVLKELLHLDDKNLQKWQAWINR